MSQQSIEPDDVNTGLLVIVGAFIAVVVTLAVVLLQAWFYNWRDELATARILPANDPQMPLGRAIAEQEAQLASYRWIDRQAGVRAIPIDQAMEAVIVEMTNPAESGKTGTERGKQNDDAKHR